MQSSSDPLKITDTSSNLETFSQITPVPSELSVSLLEVFRNAWWTSNHSLEDAEYILKSPSVVTAGIITNDKKLVAFCRAITDFKFKATILDVVVRKEYRNQGLGKKVVETLIKDSKISKVREIELYCAPGLVGFYENLNFVDVMNAKMMRLAK